MSFKLVNQNMLSVKKYSEENKKRMAVINSDGRNNVFKLSNG